MDKWNKTRWILALLFPGLATQAALVYAVLFLRQAAHGAPAFWNGGYAVLWSLWAARLWMAASTIRRQNGTEKAQSPLSTILLMYVSTIWTLFSYILAHQLPRCNPGTPSAFLVVACLTLSLSVAYSWYENWRQCCSTKPQPDAS